MQGNRLLFGFQIDAIWDGAAVRVGRGSAANCRCGDRNHWGLRDGEGFSVC